MSSLVWQLNDRTDSNKQPIEFVGFAELLGEVRSILDTTNLLYTETKVTNLSNFGFIQWANNLLNEIAVQIQKIETWLNATLAESPVYSSNLTVNQSAMRAIQNTQSTQYMFRRAALATAVNSKTLSPDCNHLETLTHTLVISFEELHRHLQKIAREEAVYRTFFQEEL